MYKLVMIVQINFATIIFIWLRLSVAIYICSFLFQINRGNFLHTDLNFIHCNIVLLLCFFLSDKTSHICFLFLLRLCNVLETYSFVEDITFYEFQCVKILCWGLIVCDVFTSLQDYICLDIFFLVIVKDLMLEVTMRNSNRIHTNWISNVTSVFLYLNAPKVLWKSSTLFSFHVYLTISWLMQETSVLSFLISKWS